MDIELIDKENNNTKFSSKYNLKINGILDEDSWCHEYELDNISGGIYKDEAIKEFSKSKFRNVSEKLISLELPITLTSKWVDRATCELFFKNKYSNLKNKIKVEFYSDPEEWSHPISIAEFSEILSRFCDSKTSDKIKYFQDDEYIMNGFGFIYQNFNTEQEIKELVSICECICEEIESYVETSVIKLYQTHSVDTSFEFPEEIKTMCEQYLIYFGQFLHDIGIEASTEIRHSDKKTLFSVIPGDKDTALTAIQEALTCYLNLPDIDNPSQYNSDISVLQLESNILHLKSQLTLAKATIQTKEQTISMLQYQQFRADNKLESDRTYDEERILDGLITVKKLEYNGLVIDTPNIVRKLKRKIWG